MIVLRLFSSLYCYYHICHNLPHMPASLNFGEGIENQKGIGKGMFRRVFISFVKAYIINYLYHFTSQCVTKPRVAAYYYYDTLILLYY